MAAGHYQFEAIHPFTDGNGRTGRILNSLFLVEQGLLPSPVLYLSRYIIRRKAEYYRLLLQVTRDEAWEPWILFVLRGVEETASWTTDRIAAIQGRAKEARDRIRIRLPKIYSRELLDVVFEQPYCRIANVVRAGVAGRQAASRYLRALASEGVLESQAASEANRTCRLPCPLSDRARDGPGRWRICPRSVDSRVLCIPRRPNERRVM